MVCRSSLGTQPCDDTMLLVLPLVLAPGHRELRIDQGRPLPPLASGVAPGWDCGGPLVQHLGSHESHWHAIHEGKLLVLTCIECTGLVIVKEPFL